MDFDSGPFNHVAFCVEGAAPGEFSDWLQNKPTFFRSHEEKIYSSTADVNFTNLQAQMERWKSCCRFDCLKNASLAY